MHYLRLGFRTLMLIRKYPLLMKDVNKVSSCKTRALGLSLCNFKGTETCMLVDIQYM